MKIRKLQTMRVVMLCGVTLLFLAINNNTQADAREKSESEVNLNAKLNEAARGGELEIVKALIDQGADVNGRSKDGQTPIMIAAVLGHLETVKYLAEKGADIDVVDEKSMMTPLHAAVAFSYTAMITLLIKKGADTSKISREHTASTLAAFMGKVEAMKAIIEAGGNVNAKNKDQMTALNIAAVQGNADIVKLLLKADADLEFQARYKESGLNIAGGTALIQAARKGHTEIVKLLLEAGANVNAVSPDRNTALTRAIAGGHSEIVTLLAAYGDRAAIKTKKKIVPLKKTETPGQIKKGSSFRVSIGEAKQLMKGWRPSKYIENDFKDHGDVIVDLMTGLMWQKSGSGRLMTFKEAQAYIQKLCRQRFAGHDDWRLPTIEELTSLLEQEKLTLHLNPLFDTAQRGCWSSDKLATGPALFVSFAYGNVDWCSLNLSCNSVRAVRDGMPHDSETKSHPPIRLRKKPMTLSTDEVTQLFKRP